jgi:integrase
VSIQKQPNGKWRARVREYPQGPERARHFDRKVDAERWQAEVRVQLARGTYLTADEQRVTLEQFAKTYVERQVWRDGTRRVAARGIDRAVSYFGAARPVSSIRRGDVEAYVAHLVGSGLAANTVRVMYQHLRSLMRAAMTDGFVVVDPTMRVKLPAPPNDELVVPNAEQVGKLIDAAGPSFAAAIVLGAYVGLRAGEVQGLRVSDIDFLRRTVNIRQQLDGRTGLAGPVKTPASRRSVPVPTFVTDVLAAHVAQAGPGDGGLLVHRDGAHLSDNRLHWLWHSAQRRAEVGPFRFHWLRHSFASSLISAGCSVKAVAMAMGHQSPAITLKTYASLWPGDDDRVRRAIELAWLAPADSLRTAETQAT